MSETPTVQNSDTDKGNGANLPSALSSSTFRWTARDQYASAAMQSLIGITRADTIEKRIDQLAAQAYNIADAMLRNA